MSSTPTYATHAALYVLISSICYALLAFIPAPTHALTVTPALVEEVIAPGSIKEITIAVLSDEDWSQRVGVAITTWRAREDGVPVFDTAAERGGAAGWVSVVPKKLVLDVGKEAKMRVRFAVPPDALPGTYPVALLLSPTPARDGGAGGTIAVSQEIGILIFLHVEGETTVGGTVAEVTPSRTVAWGLPLSFKINVGNTGTVQLVPHGVVRMVSMTGSIVHELPFNPRGEKILPGGRRTFTLTWDRGSAWRNLTPVLFGNYLVRAEVLLDGTHGTTGAATVWVLSPVTLSGLGAGTVAFGVVMERRWRKKKKRGAIF